MEQKKTELRKRIESGDQILIAEIAPPASSNGEAVRESARRYAGKVHAIGVSDNRDEVRMSAMAAASLVASEGIEPILHVTTRDRNRIALVSKCLGADALNVRNVLCTSGTHQTLGAFKTAKSVYDIDSIQLLQAIEGLGNGGSIVGGEKFEGVGPFCLGAAASPFSDPMEMQLRRLAKKITAGAQFLITQPVFDLERFEAWWKGVMELGLEKKAAFLAGIRVLTSADEAKKFAASSPSPVIPDSAIERLSSKPDESAQRSAGIEIAVEIAQKLSSLTGLRGFEVRGDGDDEAALEVIEKLSQIGN